MNKKYHKIKRVLGELHLNGDKSISHRAMIFSAMADGISHIKNISTGEDVKSTTKIMAQLGAEIRYDNKDIIVKGCGFKMFKPPTEYLDCGNSGTSARLISGLLVAQNFNSVLVGDKSLSKRPMKRVIEPLIKMGADFNTNEDLTLPIEIRGARKLTQIDYIMPVASAQVKSSILIAGLHCDEESNVIESGQTRNHTEMMLGLPVRHSDGKIISSSSKKYYPKSNEYFVPGDISSAAFHVVLTILTPDSELLIKNVSLNPTRTGFIEVLKKMGAQIDFKNIKISSNERYGDVVVKTSSLKNIDIPEELVPNIIDEIPILTIAGLFSEGNFVIRNASELRVKESDRINSICENLRILGVEIEEKNDGFIIMSGIKNTAPVFNSFDDHRIAMSFAVLSMLLDKGGEISGFDCVNISNPLFEEQIKVITEN